MPDNNGAAPPQKLAAARATVYIDIALANGQKLSFDVETATQVRDEIDMALKSLVPPKEPAEPLKKPASTEY